MYSDEIYQASRARAQAGLQLLRELLPLMSPVGRYAGWEPEERRTLGELLSAAARSSESTLLLCAYGQLWDAEVVSRSVFEGTLKFAYLLQAQETFKQRHQEYAHELFQIQRVKDHRKAGELLRALGDPQDAQWRPVRDLLLSEQELAQFSGGRDASYRRALENKWGFTGLLAELSRSGDPLFANFGGLLYGYSLASHIQHADSIGVAIALERDLRQPARRDTLHAAHHARLISDVFTSLQMRLYVGYRFVGSDPAPLVAARRSIDDLLKGFGTIYEDWMRSEYSRQFGSTRSINEGEHGSEAT